MNVISYLDENKYTNFTFEYKGKFWLSYRDLSRVFMESWQRGLLHLFAQQMRVTPPLVRIQ